MLHAFAISRTLVSAVEKQNDTPIENIEDELKRIYDSDEWVKLFIANSDNINDAMMNISVTKNNFIEKYKNSFSSMTSPIFISHQNDYFCDLILKRFTTGKKYEKNDFLDVLILGVLDKDDKILLTFDGGIITYLKKINHISYKEIERIYKIK